MRHPVEPEGVPAPQGSYSSAIVSGDLVYTSGQAGFDASGDLVAADVAGQTTQTLDNLDAVLQATGCGLADVLKVTVHLADIALFDDYDAAYRARMPQPFPARTTVGSGLEPGVLVEIDVVARKPAGA